MTPILTWIMYLRIAPVVRKLSPTVDISAYGAVSAYFSWLVAREEYSLLLVGKGYRDGGTLYGSRSPVRAHPILVGLCPVKLIKLEISSNNAHSLWQGLRISLLTPILIPVFIYNCELKTLSKSFFLRLNLTSCLTVGGMVPRDQCPHTSWYDSRSFQTGKTCFRKLVDSGHCRCRHEYETFAYFRCSALGKKYIYWLSNFPFNVLPVN